MLKSKVVQRVSSVSPTLFDTPLRHQADLPSGKPLGRLGSSFFPNLYELHLRMYRIYYVIQENEIKILVLSVEHKDEQERYLRDLTLEKIKRLLEQNR